MRCAGPVPVGLNVEGPGASVTRTGPFVPSQAAAAQFGQIPRYVTSTSETVKPNRSSMRQVRQRVARRVHVTDGAAPAADQVLVGVVRVRVVALRAVIGGHLDDLAERHHLTERVVDGGAGDLRQLGDGTGVDLVGRQVYMVPVEDLGHDTPLRGHAPAASAESFQQVTHRSKPNSEGSLVPNGCDFGPLLDLDLVHCRIDTDIRRGRLCGHQDMMDVQE